MRFGERALTLRSRSGGSSLLGQNVLRNLSLFIGACWQRCGRSGGVRMEVSEVMLLSTRQPSSYLAKYARPLSSATINLRVLWEHLQGTSGIPLL